MNSEDTGPDLVCNLAQRQMVGWQKVHDGTFFQFRINGLVGHYTFSCPLRKMGRQLPLQRELINPYRARGRISTNSGADCGVSDEGTNAFSDSINSRRSLSKPRIWRPKPMAEMSDTAPAGAKPAQVAAAAFSYVLVSLHRRISPR